MKTITVSSPGKLHLLGEHAVVYGKPAILAAINKRTTVTLTPVKGNTIEIISTNFDQHMTITPDIVLERTNLAQDAWEDYERSQDISRLTALTKDPLNFPVFVIGETLLHLKKTLHSGFSLSISCDIPLGSGMGSSASVAVSVVGAVAKFLGEPFDRDVINTIAFNAEKLVHGAPSGGDNAACTYGGLIWYRRETPDVTIIKPLSFTIASHIMDKFSIILTGKPDETTGEMVSFVRGQYTSHPHKIAEILQSQEAVTRSLLTALQQSDVDAIKESIHVGETNLESLGVVSESTKALIREIEASGGVAKICGAGGRTRASGVVLAFHENKHVLQNMIQSHVLTFAPIVLGDDGVREE